MFKMPVLPSWFSMELCRHARVHGSVFMWGCNLCRSMECALGCCSVGSSRDYDCCRSICGVGGMKEEWKLWREKKTEKERVTESQNDTSLKRPNPLKGDADGETGGNRTDKLCIHTGLFLWGSARLFQLWTVDYQKQHGPAFISLFCLVARGGPKTFKRRRKHCSRQVSPLSRWGANSRTNDAATLKCRLDLAAIKL